MLAISIKPGLAGRTRKPLPSTATASRNLLRESSAYPAASLEKPTSSLRTSRAKLRALHATIRTSTAKQNALRIQTPSVIHKAPGVARKANSPSAGLERVKRKAPSFASRASQPCAQAKKTRRRGSAGHAQSSEPCAQGEKLRLRGVPIGGQGQYAGSPFLAGLTGRYDRGYADESAIG